MEKSIRKAITLIHYNRPEYSRECLEAVALCDGFSDYTMINCVEPVCQDTIKLVSNFCEKHKNSFMFLNPDRMGFNPNKKKCLELGFSIADMVVDLDDDVVLYRDSLTFCEKHFDKINLGEKILNIALSNRQHIHVDSFKDRKDQYCVRRWFCPWGICLNRESFNFIINNGCFQDKVTFDVRTNDLLYNELHPYIGRSQNIGSLNGDNAGVYGPDWHLENHYSPIWMGTYRYHDIQS